MDRPTRRSGVVFLLKPEKKKKKLFVSLCPSRICNRGVAVKNENGTAHKIKKRVLSIIFKCIYSYLQCRCVYE